MFSVIIRGRPAAAGIAAVLSSVTFAAVVPAPQAVARPVTGRVAAVHRPIGQALSARLDADLAASRLARATHESVPVAALTTETSDTVARPDGSFTTTSHLLPVRVKTRHGWRPVSAVLVHGPAGRWATAATPSGLSLSGGGSAPLVTLDSAAGGRLGLTFPVRLPAPRVSGPVATYRDVFPGTDLIVTASTIGGVAITLEARSRAGERQMLSHLGLGISSRDLRVAAGSGGSIRATGSAGELEFSGSAPVLWTAPAAVSPSGLPVMPTTAERLLPVIARHRLTFTAAGWSPNASPARPVRITVTVTPDTFTAQTDTVQTDAGPTFDTTQQGSPCDGTSNLGVGFGSPPATVIGFNFWNSCIGQDHAYYELGLSNLNSAMQVQSATLQMWEKWSGDNACDSASNPPAPDNWPVKLYNLGRGAQTTIDGSTTWDNQPALTDSNYVGSQHVDPAHTNCASDNEVDFDVTSIMKTAVAASPIWQNWTFGLDGDETNVAGQGSNGAPCWPSSSQNCGYMGIGENPDVIVQFDLIPDAPADTETDPAPSKSPGASPYYGCGSQGPFGWISAHSANLIATLQSNINGENLAATFQVSDTNATSANDWTVTSGWIGSGDATATPTSQTGHTLLDGHQYAWYGVAEVSDSGKDRQNGVPSTYESAPSVPCTFNIDTSAPTIPTAWSADFPPSGSGLPSSDAGSAGTFTFTSADVVPNTSCQPQPCLSSGVSRFLYSLNTPIPTSGASYVTASANSNGSTATGTLSNLPIGDWGTNVLWVAAEDNAGNVTVAVPYTFYAPWNPNTKVTPGDVSGDGIPDLLGTTSGDLNLFLGNKDPNATPDDAGYASQSPDGTGAAWNTYQITHRGSFTQSGVDDLFALKGNNLYLVPNHPTDLGVKPQFNNYGSTTTIPFPACSTAQRSGNCTGYSTTNDWSSVTQILAPGDAWTGAPSCVSSNINCDTTDPSLLAVDSSGELWLYQGVFGNHVVNPILLGSSSGSPNWSGMTLIAPGDVNGALTLWARDNASGALYAYTLSIGTDGLPTLNPAGSGAPIAATSGTAIQGLNALKASDYPAVGSPGPLDNSAYPGLYAEKTTGNSPSGDSCATGCLYYYPGQAHTGLANPLSGTPTFVGILNKPVSQLS